MPTIRVLDPSVTGHRIILLFLILRGKAATRRVWGITFLEDYLNILEIFAYNWNGKIAMEKK